MIPDGPSKTRTPPPSLSDPPPKGMGAFQGHDFFFPMFAPRWLKFHQLPLTGKNSSPSGHCYCSRIGVGGSRPLASITRDSKSSQSTFIHTTVIRAHSFDVFCELLRGCVGSSGKTCAFAVETLNGVAAQKWVWSQLHFCRDTFPQ